MSNPSKGGGKNNTDGKSKRKPNPSKPLSTRYTQGGRILRRGRLRGIDPLILTVTS